LTLTAAARQEAAGVAIANMRLIKRPAGLYAEDMATLTPLKAALAMPTLKGYRSFVVIAWQASSGLALAVAAATVLAAVTPLVSITAVSIVVSEIPGVIRHGLNSPAAHTALIGAAIVGILFVVQSASTSLQGVAATVLADRIDHELQRRLMSAVMSPAGIAHLEDPATLDLITVGRDTFRAWLRPGRLAISLSQLVSARVTLVGAALIIVRYRWPLALLFLATALWAENEERRASRRAAEHHHGRSPLARRTEYYYELGVTPGAAKEIRVFGLPQFLLDRFADTWRLAMSQAMGKAGLRPMLSALSLGASTLLIFGWMCLDALHGHLKLAPDMLVYAQALMVALGAVGTTASLRLDSEMALSTLRRYQLGYDSARAGSASQVETGGDRPGLAVVATGLPRREIRFDQVRFSYPGGRDQVLNGLDLVIPAGQSLAIVGANGAGKSTLVKLLCRMYEPQSGRILVDGTELAALDLASWRHQIAAVYQDYVRYEMPARTNIGFGAVAHQDDLAGIAAAAADAGVADVIASLGSGYDTILSAGYEDGGELSGGEWQKVALARALFALRHGARMLILDEPAANLDARAEAELYERFLALTKGVTTIVISHRFSTVRQASLIAVISDGQISELGSHAELMARDTQYAHMFRLQAARFDQVGA
jgi:ATP-binding cassette subfamily B protein